MDRDFNSIAGLDEYCRLYNRTILLEKNKLKGIVINEGYPVQ